MCCDIAKRWIHISEFDKVEMARDCGFLQGIDDLVFIPSQRAMPQDANIDVRVGASPALGARAEEKNRELLGREDAKHDSARHVEMPVGGVR